MPETIESQPCPNCGGFHPPGACPKVAVLEKTKKFSPNAQGRLGEKLTELRKIEAEKMALQQKIENLKQETEDKKRELGEVIHGKEVLEDELAIHQIKTLSKVFDFLKIAEIERKLAVREKNLEEIQKHFDQAMDLLHELEGQLQDRTELDELKKTIETIYHEEAERVALEECESENKVKDVNQVSHKYNAIFVHTFNTTLWHETLGAAGLTVLEKGIKWQQALKSIIGLQPDLSTSTVRLGTQDATWSKMGVVLRGGSIEAAHACDAKSTVRGSEKFTEDKLGGALKNQEEKLKKVITYGKEESTSYNYNELIVRRPETGGFFFDSEFPKEYYSGVFGEAERLGLPVYFRDQSGEFYLISYDLKSKDFQKNKKVSVDEILNNAAITEDQRSQARDEIFEDCPFKLDSIERKSFDSWKRGQNIYNGLNAQNRPKNLFHHPDFSQGKDFGIIPIAQYGSLRVERPCIDNESYIEGIQNLLDNYENKCRTELENIEEEVRLAKKSLEERRLRLQKNQEEELARIIYFGYGFAEAAKKAGDAKTYEDINIILSSKVPIRDYHDFIKRRLGKTGGFRITEEDLKHITTRG